jgi:hypothetical protein
MVLLCGRCEIEILHDTKVSSKCSSFGYVTPNMNYEYENYQAQMQMELMQTSGTGMFERQKIATLQKKSKYFRLCCQCYLDVQGVDEELFFNQDGCPQCGLRRQQMRGNIDPLSSLSTTPRHTPRNSSHSMRTRDTSLNSFPQTTSGSSSEIAAYSPGAQLAQSRLSFAKPSRRTPTSASPVAIAAAAVCVSFGYLREAPVALAMKVATAAARAKAAKEMGIAQASRSMSTNHVHDSPELQE